ncbi:MAG: prolipoprotein diacylglyceryl transferase [Armatimonadota bacterium]
MCPTLFQVPALPAWAAAVLAVLLGGAGLLVDALEQRRARGAIDWRRAAAIALAGALVGLAVWYALSRWGPVQVRAWGTMLMLGFLVGMAWAVYDGREDRAISFALMVDLTLAILVGAIIGSRLMSVLLEWDAYVARPGAVLRVWEGGLSFHGGLLGGTIAGSLMLWRLGLSIPRMADLVAPSIALGYAITRIGCFLNGCCYGVPTDSAVGVHFHFAGEADIARHPTQLYSAALSLLIFAILLAVRRRLHRPGHLALLYLVLYSAARFLVEHFRRGASAVVMHALAPLTYAQVASIVIALVAAGVILLDRRRASAPEPADGHEVAPAAPRPGKETQHV